MSIKLSQIALSLLLASAALGATVSSVASSWAQTRMVLYNRDGSFVNSGTSINFYTIDYTAYLLMKAMYQFGPSTLVSNLGPNTYTLTANGMGYIMTGNHSNMTASASVNRGTIRWLQFQWSYNTLTTLLNLRQYDSTDYNQVSTATQAAWKVMYPEFSKVWTFN